MHGTRTTSPAAALRAVVAGAALAAIALLAGCAADGGRGAPGDASAPAAATTDLPRRQGYALLYGLLKDESKVDGILILKDASPGTKEAIRSIASRAARGRDELDAWAKSDPTLILDETDLPAVEVETRDAIASKTAKLLLTSSGDAFELNLLLTQYEALKYLAALSEALAERESDPSRKATLEALAADATTLHEGVMLLLEQRRAADG